MQAIQATAIELPPQPTQVPAFRFDRNAMAGLSAIDQHRFERFGQGPRSEPPFALIHRAFEANARRDPSAVAAEHGSASITYGELDTAAEQLGATLRSLGVGRGDDVCLFVRRSIPMVVGLLAALKVGAAYVPQDVTIAPAAQLEHIMRVTNSAVVLTLAEHRHLVPDTGTHQVIAIDDPASHPDTPTRLVPAEAGSPSDRCFVLFTSGTTGNPNGVQVTHGNVCNILLTDPGNLAIGPGTRVAQMLNIAFDMAAWEILGCLGNGGTLVIRGDDFQAVAEQAHVLIATPTVLGTIDPSRATGVRVAAVAGEPCPRPLAEAWGGQCTFYNSCGPTETTIINTAAPFRPGDADLTIGSPTPNNTVYILDEHRRPLPIGEVGEMWAGGECVTHGYLGNEQLTDERYAPDPFLGGDRKMFRTRDLGRWTPDGRLLHYGRTDDQVKVRGFRVELDSVSNALETTPGCTKAVTLKLDDRNLAAAVTPSTVDVGQAAEAVAAALPYYCVPAVIMAMDAVPMTARGKVDKRALLSLAQAETVPA